MDQALFLLQLATSSSTDLATFRVDHFMEAFHTVIADTHCAPSHHGDHFEWHTPAKRATLSLQFGLTECAGLPPRDALFRPLFTDPMIRTLDTFLCFFDRLVASGDPQWIPVAITMLNRELCLISLFKGHADDEEGNSTKPLATHVQCLSLLEPHRSVGVCKLQDIHAGDDRWRTTLAHKITLRLSGSLTQLTIKAAHGESAASDCSAAVSHATPSR